MEDPVLFLEGYFGSCIYPLNLLMILSFLKSPAGASTVTLPLFGMVYESICFFCYL